MTTRELLSIALSAIAGAGLAVLFFGGLWWTVRRAMSSPQPALWFAGSLLLRTGFVVVGLYFIAVGDWRRLVACLIGFVAARMVVIRIVHSADTLSPVAGGKVSHAP